MSVHAEIISFVLRIAKSKRDKDGKLTAEISEEIIQPWKDVKGLQGYEWLRDATTSITGEIRQVESATYVATQENIPVYIPGQAAPYTQYNVAVFQDNKDGKIYDIAQRLAEIRGVKMGDIVRLNVLGCCSIMDIIKKDANKSMSDEEEDQGGIVGNLEEEEEEQ